MNYIGRQRSKDGTVGGRVEQIVCLFLNVL